MAKSDKLYSDSPSIKKNSDGNPGVSKPSKADAENMSIEGSPLNGSKGEMEIDLKQAEYKSMHKRHQEETSSMHERHLKDVKEMHSRHEKAKTSDLYPDSEDSNANS